MTKPEILRMADSEMREIDCFQIRNKFNETTSSRYDSFVSLWKDWAKDHSDDLETEIRKARTFCKTPSEVLVNNFMKCFPCFMVCENEDEDFKNEFLKDFGVIAENQTMENLQSNSTVFNLLAENTRRPSFERNEKWIENLKSNMAGVYFEVEKTESRRIKMFFSLNIFKNLIKSD